MSRRLNVASALLFAVAILPVFGGLSQMLLLPGSEISGEELPTVSQIRDFSPKLVDTIDLSTQTRGLYLLILALFWSVISLIPYRKGEKWAWYAMLAIGPIFAPGILIVNYTGATLGLWPSFWITLGIIWLILWIVGLALPAKEILGKPSS
ncbi:MAG: hypothetical protein ACE5K0_07320 [Candidatus Methanofastidiosia archaeon]